MPSIDISDNKLDLDRIRNGSVLCRDLPQNEEFGIKLINANFNTVTDSETKMAQFEDSFTDNNHVHNRFVAVNESPATVQVDTMETVNLDNIKHIQTTENSHISKGIILNTTEFGLQKDVKWIPGDIPLDKSKEYELSEKPDNIKLSESSAGQANDTKKKENTEMTLLRKILFGMSLLPSVLFVLCFAVILPCEMPKSCTQEKWSVFLNDTEIRTDLILTEGILTGIQKNITGEVLSLSIENGKQLWEWKSTYSPRFITCQNFDVNNDSISDCLLVDTLNTFYTFNASNGYIFWNLSVSTELEETVPPLPVILPDCDSDSVPELAVAISESVIQIISNGTFKYRVNITDCSTIPHNLLSWSHDNVTDIIFNCIAIDGNETVRLLPQRLWCSVSRNELDEPLNLLNSGSMELTHPLFATVEEGLIIWTGNNVFKYVKDGKKQWKHSSKNHTDQRFMLVGNFYEKEKLLALVSGDITVGIIVTLLNLESGNETLTWTIPNAEVNNVVLVPGKTTDNLLLWLKQNQRQKSDVELQNVATNVSLLSPANDVYRKSPYSLLTDLRITTVSKLILLQFQEKEQVEEKKIFSCDNENLCVTENQHTTITVSSNNDANKLTVIIGRTFLSPTDTSALQYTSEIKCLKVDNWDNSEDETSSYCTFETL